MTTEARMLPATRLSEADLASLSGVLPQREPPLANCPDGPRAGACYPVAETRLVGNERRYLNECVDTNWISSRGPFIERFETAFARECGTRHAVACANGTVALHLAMAALGIGPGDEVIVPAFTMIASANAARYTGATVRLVDAEDEFCNIDSDRIEAAITPATRAIVVVHVYGHPARMDAIQRIASKHGLDVIEDAAEAHGAELDGARVGGLGRVSTFSFYANKIVTTGEGGMVCTNDPALAALARKLRDHAFSPERHFWHEYLGFNYRMTNLQAAVGLAQVERLDDIVAARRRLAGWYGARLGQVPGIATPRQAPGARSVYWMYAIRVEPAFGASRDELREALAARGIETRTFFIPIHLQPIYFEQFRGQSFPVAERLCKTGLYLPTSEALGEDDVDWICQQVAGIGARRG
jgi:perosamine synthetase